MLRMFIYHKSLKNPSKFSMTYRAKRDMSLRNTFIHKKYMIYMDYILYV